MVRQQLYFNLAASQVVSHAFGLYNAVKRSKQQKSCKCCFALAACALVITGLEHLSELQSHACMLASTTEPARCMPGKLSLRASPTGEVRMTDCRVPAANLLPGTGGLKSPLTCLTQAREVMPPFPSSFSFIAAAPCALRISLGIMPSLIMECSGMHKDELN